MAEDKPEGATNHRPINDTVAESGPGLPDEAVGPGQISPDEQRDLATGDEEAVRRKLGAPAPRPSP